MLQLNGNARLRGSLPHELGGMAALRELRSNACALTGTLPQLSSLTRLRVLELEANSISGTISPHIGGLSRLEVFNCAGCSLSGTLPCEAGQLSSLRALNLGENKLVGSLVPEIGNLGNLTELNVRALARHAGGAAPARRCGFDLRPY